MPRLMMTFAIFLIALPGAAADSVGEPASHIQDFAAAALSRHESIKRAESAVRRAEANIDLSRSILLPSLTVNGAYTRYRDEQALDLGEGERFVIQPIDDWSWSANVTQTLFSGLRDWRAKDVAQLQRDAALLEYRTAASDLVLEVAAAFFETVTAEQRVEVRQQALENITAQLRVAQRRYEVGEVTTADVARWRAQVAAARQDLVIAEGESRLGRRRLERLCGVRAGQKLLAAGRVPAPQGSLDELVDEAVENRLEIQTLRNQLSAAGLMIKIEKGAWLPEANANLGYYRQKADFPTQDWTSLAINLRIPVYDGGLTSARVAQAREDLRELELLRQEVVKLIADQVDVAAISHQAAEAAFRAAEERTEAAREAHRQVDRAYRAGEASATDLLATTTELTDAENTLIIARWQREMQAIALRHAIGQTPLPEFTYPGTDDEETDS